MKLRRLILIAILIALLPTLSVQAQVASGGTKHFDKNGLEFDYPAAWKMADGSAEESQYVELATETKTTQLIVNWQFGAALRCEVEEIRKKISQELANRVATQIHNPAPAETSWQKIQFGMVDGNQIQLRGSLNNDPVTADVYSLAVNHYFLNLVYLRVSNDAMGNSAWKTIETTMKVGEPGREGNKPSAGGVLNGRAIRLPKPFYPELARSKGASGVVVVEVLIDERGNVVGACAIAGHWTLQKVAVDAARDAKFTPTKVSGKPVRVDGVITYNFVRM
jgi:TonB family protein